MLFLTHFQDLRKQIINLHGFAKEPYNGLVRQSEQARLWIFETCCSFALEEKRESRLRVYLHVALLLMYAQKNIIISSTLEQLPELFSKPITPGAIMWANQKVLCGQSCDAEEINKYSPVLNSYKSSCLGEAVPGSPTEHNSHWKVLLSGGTRGWPELLELSTACEPGLLCSTGGGRPSRRQAGMPPARPFLQAHVTPLALGTFPSLRSFPLLGREM